MLKMENKWVVANYYHYGSGWSSEYREVFKNKDEALKFEELHREKYKNVSGVEHVDFEYSYVTEKELRGILTFNEYTELLPYAERLSNEEVEVLRYALLDSVVNSETLRDFERDVLTGLYHRLMGNEEPPHEESEVELKEHRLNKKESLTVMDMVQDTIGRGMIAGHYETSKIEEIISKSTNSFDEFTKEFEITVRIK